VVLNAGAALAAYDPAGAAGGSLAERIAAGMAAAAAAVDSGAAAGVLDRWVAAAGR
jgi:anthranilate phosphoribosyltransferase